MYGTKTWSQFLNFKQVSAWGTHKEFFIELEEYYNFPSWMTSLSLKTKKL